MRQALSSQYPGDDIILMVLLGAIFIWAFVEIANARLKHKSRSVPRRITGHRHEQDRLTAKQAQDAKDQETLNRATEYRNDFSK